MKKTELEIIEQVKSKWIQFRITDQLPKTVKIAVRSKEDDILLGIILWYSRWRCYIYEPQPNTIYEKVCMREIANLSEQLTNNQKTKSKEKTK